MHVSGARDFVPLDEQQQAEDMKPRWAEGLDEGDD